MEAEGVVPQEPCVCVWTAVALLTLTTAALPSAGQNRYDGLTQAYIWGAKAGSAAQFLFNNHCDQNYDPVEYPMPIGCVFSCPYVGYSPITCISPLTAASVVNNGTVRFGLDCFASFDQPNVGITLRSRLYGVEGTNDGFCEKSVGQGGTFIGQFGETFWTWDHPVNPNPIQPILIGPRTMTNVAEYVGTSIEITLKMVHNWLLWQGVLTSSAELHDTDFDSSFDSNDATLHQWNITDPGGDDKLFKGGLDITPSIGTTVNIGLDLDVTREDAGGGNVVWRLRSTAANQYVVVDQVEEHSVRLWNFYALST